MYVTEPVRGLTRTATAIGWGNVIVGVIACLALSFAYGETGRRAYVVLSYWALGVLSLPGAALLLLAWRTNRGSLPAAIALVTLGFVEGAKFFLVTIPLIPFMFRLMIRTGGDWRTAFFPAALLINCSLALSEVRFQLRAQRRNARMVSQGFQPVIQVTAPAARPAHAMRPPPARLKPDSRRPIAEAPTSPVPHRTAPSTSPATSAASPASAAPAAPPKTPATTPPRSGRTA